MAISSADSSDSVMCTTRCFFIAGLFCRILPLPFQLLPEGQSWCCCVRRSASTRGRKGSSRRASQSIPALSRTGEFLRGTNFPPKDCILRHGGSHCTNFSPALQCKQRSCQYCERDFSHDRIPHHGRWCSHEAGTHHITKALGKATNFKTGKVQQAVMRTALS